MTSNIRSMCVASNAAAQTEYLAAATELHAMFANGTLFVPPAFVEVSSIDDSCDKL